MAVMQAEAPKGAGSGVAKERAAAPSAPVDRWRPERRREAHGRLGFRSDGRAATRGQGLAESPRVVLVLVWCWCWWSWWWCWWWCWWWW